MWFYAMDGLYYDAPFLTERDIRVSERYVALRQV